MTQKSWKKVQWYLDIEAPLFDKKGWFHKEFLKLFMAKKILSLPFISPGKQNYCAAVLSRPPLFLAAMLCEK